jgi:hypothetical protein
VYVAGSFMSSAIIVGGTVLRNTSTRNNQGNYTSNDVLVAKLTDAGASASFAWAKAAGGPYDERVESLALFGTDAYLAVNSLFAPRSGTTVTFGTVVVPLTTNTHFFTKVIDAGNSSNFAWVQSSSLGVSAMTATSSDLYMVGYFSGTATLGGTTLVADAEDAYVAKWNPASAGFVWAVKAGGVNTEGARALAVQGTHIYVAGSFNSPAAAFGNTVLAASNAVAGASDLFVAQLTNAGASASIDWAQQAGGKGFNAGYAVTNVGSTVYVGGEVSPLASFGNQSITVPTGGATGFLATLASSTLATTIPTTMGGVSLSPNPARGTATVQVPPIPGATTATIVVLDALGRRLRTQNVATNANAELDLAGLAPGLYAVRVQAGRSAVVQRLVVE